MPTALRHGWRALLRFFITPPVRAGAAPEAAFSPRRIFISPF